MLTSLAQALIGQKFDLLDKGYIRVVDLLGGDHSVLEAARQTLDGAKKGDDRDLIRYLMRHRHTSPFEFAEIVLEIKAPMDMWRQMIRHRTASVNEYSTRYSEAIDDMAETTAYAWRKQSKSNRQGSEDYLPAEGDKGGSYLSRTEKMFHSVARTFYKERLECGVAREQARKDLPLSNYTKAYWKIDLHNLLHFLGLRMDARAQYEIRQYANVIGYNIVAEWCPITWEAFKDFRLHAITFSYSEQIVLERVLRVLYSNNHVAIDDIDFPDWQGKQKVRERDEFFEKLARIGIVLRDGVMTAFKP